MHFKLGFSLIEILVVLAISAILILSSTWSITNNDLLIKASEIEAIIKFSKLSAYNSHQKMSLEAFSANNWRNGFKLFSVNKDKSKILIHSWHWPNNKITINWRGLKQNIIFRGDLNHEAANGYFLLMLSGKEVKINVNRLGRIKTVVN